MKKRIPKHFYDLSKIIHQVNRKVRIKSLNFLIGKISPIPKQQQQLMRITFIEPLPLPGHYSKYVMYRNSFNPPNNPLK